MIEKTNQQSPINNQQCYMSSGFNRSDIVDFFLVEASEHLQVLNDGLLSLESNKEDLSVMDEIFRSAHTIKGSAAMLGFNIISKLAHKMEDLLGKIRNRELSLSESVIDLLLQTVDSLTAQIEDIPNGAPQDEAILQMFTDLYAEFLEVPIAEVQAGVAEEAASAGSAPEPEPLDESELLESELLQELEIPSFPEEVERTGGSDLLGVSSEGEPAEQPEEMVSPPLGVQKLEISQAKKPFAAQKQSLVSASEKKFVKVGVEGLNLLMNLVGELVINRTRLDQRIAYLNKLSSELNFSRDRLLKVIRDFKEKYEFGQVQEAVDAVADIPEQGGNGHSLKGVQGTELLEGFFELEFDKYDDFNILSRSLMEIGSDISEIMNQLNTFFDQFEEESSQIRRITNDLQEEITNIRMVQVGQLFTRFQRTVRDVAKDEAKEAVLKISGEDAKLDKPVIDEIADPLMHLVRNSISHGIEPPDVRESRGKPREGEVVLNAYKEGDNIIIEVSDDGNGIDVNRIREIVAEKGLRSMAEVERMSDDEAIKFIFAPGFSTKKEVSAISGRGVGMDVVKTNIARLGGSIEIKTVLGQGTKFSIKLPLTLLIYAALLVKCGEQEFAISLTSVEETARIPIAHVHKVGTHEVIKLRDQVLPIRRLSRILEYNHHTESSDQQAYVPIVIVRSAEQILALMVDELIGRETIVVKPLGDYLKKVKLFSGATISGEGKVRFILDIPTIVQQEFVSKMPGKVAAMTIPLESEAYEEFATPVQPKEQASELILIDDSISIRKMMGMFLSNAGYQVELANDGVEAIEKISTHPYDLIITDLEMPRMHGYELIAEVRSAPETKQIPIIVLTSRAGDKHYKKAMDLGANDYIVKPVDEGTLLESVRKLLSR
jgi:chemosensory pili system protein ChpA (sensor histidine kinase/response regulator)